MHDIVIRGGTVVDGTGAERFTGDIAIDGERISQVGEVREKGQREIDASGLIVAPGFVDIHTHYDGQATWDGEMAPSSWHGVTTVVMGNCGVGFAPAAPDRHEWLIGLMEGVEDIPGAALHEGMSWDWETFPEYLDALEKLPRTVDVGTHVPHGAVRAYVMGERGAANQEPTSAEIEQMSRIVEEGLRAGALGFSTSRTILHKSVDGELVPGTTATKEELVGIGRAMGRVGHGVFEMASDPETRVERVRMDGRTQPRNRPARDLRRAAVNRQGNPAGRADRRHRRRRMRRGANIARADRAEGQRHPSCAGAAPCTPSCSSLPGRKLPSCHGRAQYERLSDAAFRRRPHRRAERLPGGSGRRAAAAAGPSPWAGRCSSRWARTSTTNRSRRRASPPARRPAGTSPEEYAYDQLMAKEGSGFIYFPILNYADGNLDFVKPLLERDDCVISLSDGRRALRHHLRCRLADLPARTLGKGTAGAAPSRSNSPSSASAATPRGSTGWRIAARWSRGCSPTST